MSVASVILGEDGSGYELARRLEACGTWRAWLSNADYVSFSHHLASPAAWDAFLSSNSSNSNGNSSASSSSSRQLLWLQLRVRALLFDKASVAVNITKGELGSGGVVPSALNPTYFQLHGDDVYYTLEDERDDRNQSQIQARSVFSPSKDSSSTSQRHRLDELLHSWIKQYNERFKMKRLKMPSTGREVTKRTPEGMSAYIKLCNIHQKKRRIFVDEQGAGSSVPMVNNGSSLHPKGAGDFIADDTLIPEIMFPCDCVPDSALPIKSFMNKSQTEEIYGVLDKLPMLRSRSTAMLERFGMAPDYYKMGSKYRGKDGSCARGISISQEQASVMTKQIVARFLLSSGFQSASAASIEVLSEITSRHICKLGRILKLLTDSYRKQYSSIELLKMFLQTIGYSNIGALTEGAKSASRLSTNQTLDNQPLQAQQQTISVHHQVQRQMQPQMNLAQPQTLAFHQQPQQLMLQQQWDKVRRKQIASHGQPPVTVKIENAVEAPNDSAYSSVNAYQQSQLRQQQMQHMQHQLLQQRQMQQQQQSQLQQHQIQQQQPQLQQQQQPQLQQPQLQQHQIQQQQQPQLQHQIQQQSQLQHQIQQHQQPQQQQQQQQIAMAASQSAQPGQQFKQSGMQMTQLQSQNPYGMRMPTVKVEAFHELGGEDSSVKSDNDPSKFTAPSK